MSDIGSRIKEVKKRSGLTQREFAARVKVKLRTLTSYFSNDTNPTASVLQRICEGFNVSSSWLLLNRGKMYDSLDPTEWNQMAGYFEALSPAYRNFALNFIGLLKNLQVIDPTPTLQRVAKEFGGHTGSFGKYLTNVDDKIWGYIKRFLKIERRRMEAEFLIQLQKTAPGLPKVVREEILRRKIESNTDARKLDEELLELERSGGINFK